MSSPGKVSMRPRPRSNTYSAVHRPTPGNSKSRDAASRFGRSANDSRGSSPVAIFLPSPISSLDLKPLKPSERRDSGVAAARSSGLGKARSADRNVQLWRTRVSRLRHTDKSRLVPYCQNAFVGLPIPPVDCVLRPPPDGPKSQIEPKRRNRINGENEAAQLTPRQDPPLC
jgi:hypothetical protein